MGLVLASCSSSRDSGQEAIATTQSAIFRVEASTTVEAGSASPRNATCPGGTLPDQCGSWAGVELKVSRSAGDHPAEPASSVSHCLCEAIDFQIPVALPVTGGGSGWSWDKPTFSFRNAAGATVSCRYRGNGTSKVGGNAYTLDSCSNGAQAGQAARGDYFTFSLDDTHPEGQAVTVTARLGEPDVVDGVVQEQVFYATDPRIANAALHVPRGSAPAGETFSLDLVPQVPPATLIANGGDSATSLGYGVDVHSDSTAIFVFTPVPGAGCPRVELPYDQDTVAQLLGPGGESRIQAKHLTSLVDLANGAAVLESMAPVKVNLAQRTVSFCVEHLSIYLAADNGDDSDLASAKIRSVSGSAPGFPTLPSTDLGPTLTQLPTLHAGETYELKLVFTNVGTTDWVAGGQLHLVAVSSFVKTPTAACPSPPCAVAAGAGPWGAPLTNSSFTPSPVNDPMHTGTLSYSTAEFTFNITPTTTPAPLNFCLRRGNNRAFGDCFTWDLSSAPNPGASTTVGETSRDCYTGTPGTAGIGECKTGTQTFDGTSWSTCDGEVIDEDNETECDGKDEDCDGTIDDDGVKNACNGCAELGHALTDTCDNGRTGICFRSANYQCSGVDAVTCTPQTDGVENACGGCNNHIAIPPGTPCNNGREGTCFRTGVYECSGTDATVCNAQTVGVENACGLCTDHCVKFRMEEIDDDAFLWDGIPLDTTDAICQTRITSLGRGFAECDLTRYIIDTYGGVDQISFDGEVGLRDFTFMLGNGGGFQTFGIFSLVIDGQVFELSREWHEDFVHTGWVHGHRFMVNFVTGAFDPLYRDPPANNPCGSANPKACCLPTDCMLPFFP